MGMAGVVLDIEGATKFFQKQLNGGAGSIVLLALLKSQRQPMYGYQIAQELERRNGRELPMSSGALYPALRSLEKQGLLSSETELSDAGRARRYYKITKLGRDALREWQVAWADHKRFVDQILEQDDDESNSAGDRAVSKRTRRGSRAGAQ